MTILIISMQCVRVSFLRVFPEKTNPKNTSVHRCATRFGVSIVAVGLRLGQTPRGRSNRLSSTSGSRQRRSSPASVKSSSQQQRQQQQQQLYNQQQQQQQQQGTNKNCSPVTRYPLSLQGGGNKICNPVVVILTPPPRKQPANMYFYQ